MEGACPGGGAVQERAAEISEAYALAARYSIEGAPVEQVEHSGPADTPGGGGAGGGGERGGRGGGEVEGDGGGDDDGQPSSSWWWWW
jgi:hypothetical protein